jgi:hypothetical protein
MAVSSAKFRLPQKPAGKQRKVMHSRVKSSAVGRAYNKVRMLCYFLPVLGFLIIGYGICLTLWKPETDIIIPQTVIAGGAIISYLAIYYNKRR